MQRIGRGDDGDVELRLASFDSLSGSWYPETGTGTGTDRPWGT
jgi:hypothetical protein